MSEKDYMLTTYDNPFNPFKDFELWWKEDLILGHDCCGTLARVACLSDLASDEQNQIDIDRAMDQIVADEPMIYRKVLPSDYDNAA